MKQTRKQRRRNGESRWWGSGDLVVDNPIGRGSNNKRDRKSFPKRKNRRQAKRRDIQRFY